MKDTTDEMLNRLRDNWLPAEELPTVSVDEYLNLLNANWIEPDAPQEAAKRGHGFPATGVRSDEHPCIVRIRRGGAHNPVEHEFAARSVFIAHSGGAIYVDIYTDPYAPADADTAADAPADANSDRDALPDLDAAANVDGAPDADGDGDVDGSAQRDGGGTYHRDTSDTWMEYSCGRNWRVLVGDTE